MKNWNEDFCKAEMRTYGDHAYGQANVDEEAATGFAARLVLLLIAVALLALTGLAWSQL